MTVAEAFSPYSRLALDGSEGEIRVRAVGRSGGDEVAADTTAILTWLTNFITQPHQLLGRNGAVCPFVAAALDDEKIEVSLHYEAGPQAATKLVELVSEEAEEFAARVSARSVSLDSRIVAFPLLCPIEADSFEDAHRVLKERLVPRGLMVGRFHPHCDEPAVGNDRFRVFQAAIPVFVVRWMATHDILFLRAREDWTRVYASRFAEAHARGRIRDARTVEAFDQARRAFGIV